MLEEWAFANDGDITNFPLNENLDGIEMERKSKLLSIACVIKDYEDQEESIDKEMKRLAQRKKSAQSKAESIRHWLELNVEPGEKIGDSRAEIAWRKSTYLDVTCEPESLPKYLQKVTISADKTAIKEALNRGETIEGCALATRQNMQIK